MRYEEFRDAVRDHLMLNPEGVTWKELREALDLPYERPCPEWVKRLENDMGLDRKEKMGRALLWKMDSESET
jgi:hypothetical protein